MKTYKKKHKITTSAGSNTIDNIQVQLDKITRVEDWDGRDMHEPLLFPPHKMSYLLRGEDSAQFTKKPGLTKCGEKFCLSALISSAAVCNQLLTQHDTVKFSIIEGFGDGGLQLKDTQFPFFGVDSIGSFVSGGAIVLFGTITKNHHSRILGCGAIHSEQPPTLEESIESFSAGFRIVQKKLRQDETYINEVLDNLHIHSDDAPAIKIPVNQYLNQKTTFGTESSCSAHIHNDGLPKNKAKLKKPDNYGSVCSHINMLQNFPVHAYGNIPWMAVRRKWNSMHETDFREFENEHIDKNQNFTAGSVALGTPDDNNFLGSINEHKMRKLFTSAYRRENDKARLPMPISEAIRILATELMPSWSQATDAPGQFETDFETTAQERRFAKEYMLDPYLLQLGDGIYCTRFAGKKSAPLCKSTAQKAFRLHQEAIEAIEARLQEGESEIEWSWDDFKLASSVVFTSEGSCTCKQFLTKKKCLHLMAIRELLGLEGLKIGINEDDNNEILRRKRGGNKRLRGHPSYKGIVDDRLIHAERNKAKEDIKARKEIRKRRSEQQMEMKTNKRPRRGFICQDCDKKMNTRKGLKAHCTIKKHKYVDDEDGSNEGDNCSEDGSSDDAGA